MRVFALPLALALAATASCVRAASGSAPPRVACDRIMDRCHRVMPAVIALCSGSCPRPYEAAAARHSRGRHVLALLAQGGARNPRKPKCRRSQRSEGLAKARRDHLGEQPDRQLAALRSVSVAAKCLECLRRRLLPARRYGLPPAPVHRRTAFESRPVRNRAAVLATRLLQRSLR